MDRWDGETRTVYQFHECFWHGHCCRLTEKHHGNKHPVKKVPFDSLWDKTKGNENYIENLDGVDRLVVITECRWREKVKRTPEIKEFVECRFRHKLVKYWRLEEKKILQAVLREDFFGVVECDLTFPMLCENISVNFVRFSRTYWCPTKTLGRPSVSLPKKQALCLDHSADLSVACMPKRFCLAHHC